MVGELYGFLIRMFAVIEGIEVVLGVILAVGLVVIVRWALTRYGG